MDYDEPAAFAKRAEILDTARRARQVHAALSDDQLEAVVQAFTHVEAPEEPEATIGFTSREAMLNAPASRALQPGNVFLNWRKLVDVVPALAPADPARSWSMMLAGLHVWNRIWKGGTDDLGADEAIALLALWKQRDGEGWIEEAPAIAANNDLRALCGLAALTPGQFSAIVYRLVTIDCIVLDGSSIWTREWVKVKFS